MSMFRKKPVIIEARRINSFDYDECCEILNWCGGQLPTTGELEGDRMFYIQTLEGPIWASAGDWIIKGVAGEFYPCKPDIFAQTYEEVPE